MPMKRSDAHTLCAMTMHDLFKGDYNYLFGLGSSNGTGVFSFYRQDPASPACEFWNGSDEREAGDDEVRGGSATVKLLHQKSVPVM